MVKSETSSCGFAKIGVKGGENSSKRREGSTLIYKTSIQIYDQISIMRNWSEVKIHRVFFPRVGLKGVQIAQTIAKVGMLVFISNGHSNLWSNFKSENLVKSETP